MNKKSIIGIVVGIIMILCAGAAALYFLNRPKDNSVGNNQPNNSSNNSQENTKVNDSKILVAYYSAQNHTKNVAEKIARNLGADTFEIVPKDVYSAADLDWTDDSSRVNAEHNDESLRDIELVNTTVPNWGEYDTVLIGYPIWWGIAAWPTNGFVRANNFDGKTVIPFCTSTSSGIGQSDQLLAGETSTGNWLAGHRFSSSPSDSDIKSWTDSL